MTERVSNGLRRTRLAWRVANVVAVEALTPRAKALRLAVAEWPGHLPGQRVDIRLTSADGYQAQRSYSISSPPEDASLELTVETVEGGEVSPYLTGEVRVGDAFEVRGPIGGYFAWSADRPGPLLLIAGGSGIAPLMAMLRHRALSNNRCPATLVYSCRTFEDVIFADELDRIAAEDETFHLEITLTRGQPQGWSGNRRRIDEAMLRDIGVHAAADAAVFVCGPTDFVEAAAQLLVGMGFGAENIRTERFGPSGAEGT